MNTEAFYINGRYFIDPTSNLLRDGKESKETRLEPRILEVLCLLAARPGITVTRDEMVAVIWKDYGGGDEGLTQAISTLRKLLSDTGKELIQTIPKKGYCFKGQVSFHAEKLESPAQRSRLPRMKRSLAIVAVVMLIGLVIIFNPFNSKEKSDHKTSAQPLVVAFPGLQPSTDSTEENEKNTIVSIAPDSTIYKLVMIGDEPPRFYINSKSIPVHEWEPYQELINKLKRELRKKR